jgi:hypothetical protein
VFGNDASSRAADLTACRENDADDQPAAEDPGCKGHNKRSHRHRCWDIALSPPDGDAGDKSDSERNQDRPYLIAQVDPPMPKHAQEQSGRNERTTRRPNPNCPTCRLIPHEAAIGTARHDLEWRRCSLRKGSGMTPEQLLAKKACQSFNLFWT